MQLLTSVLLSGDNIIDFDGTLVVQLVIFFIAFFILRSLVFKPMIALLDARETSIEGARQEAKRMQKEAAEKGDAFEEEMRKLRVTAQAERDRLRQEGLRLERTVLEKVREETSKNLTDAQVRLDSERTRIRAEVQTNIPKLASEIASRLLGREVQ
jgi:F-type H+-transporting ATPase subunit b